MLSKTLQKIRCDSLSVNYSLSKFAKKMSGCCDNVILHCFEQLGCTVQISQSPNEFDHPNRRDMCIIGFIHFYSSRDQVESILEITCHTNSIKDVAVLVVERSCVGRIII